MSQQDDEASAPPDQGISSGDRPIDGHPAPGGPPGQIAPSYVFLASADARFYTGEILAPTGRPATTR